MQNLERNENKIKKLHQQLKTTVIYNLISRGYDLNYYMKDGFIEQIDSVVFNNPVNVFVATFIGSPPMNIIECSVLETRIND